MLTFQHLHLKCIPDKKTVDGINLLKQRAFLSKLHTNQLLKLRQIAFSWRVYLVDFAEHYVLNAKLLGWRELEVYNKLDGDTFVVSMKEVKRELATREHILTTKDSKVKRKLDAMFR